VVVPPVNEVVPISEIELKTIKMHETTQTDSSEEVTDSEEEQKKHTHAIGTNKRLVFSEAQQRALREVVNSCWIPTVAVTPSRVYCLQRKPALKHTFSGA
jgi:hypothetical protein